MQPLTSSNWAILFTGYEPAWSFGEGLTEEITLYIYGLVTSLREFGNKWTGADITTIVLGDSRHPFINNHAIMIIQAGKEISLVVSDPQTTVQLLAREDIPVDVEGALQGVLVGNALQLYSKYYSGLYEYYSAYIDMVFEKALEAAGLSHKATVKHGHSDFSRLTLTDLLLFHVHLRTMLERTNPTIQEDSWFLVAGKDGTPIPIHLGLLYDESISLVAFLCTVYNYSQKIFGQAPYLLIFGQDQLTYLYFVSGNEYLCFARQPRILVHDKHFYKALESLPSDILDDVEEPLKYFLADIISREVASSLVKQPLLKIRDKVRRSRLLPPRVPSKPERYLKRYQVILRKVGRLNIGEDLLSKPHDILITGIVTEELRQVIKSRSQPWSVQLKRGQRVSVTLNAVEGLAVDDVPSLIKPASKSSGVIIFFDQENLQTFIEAKSWLVNVFAASPKPYLPALLVGTSRESGQASTNNDGGLAGATSRHAMRQHPQVRISQVASFLSQIEQGIGKKDLVLYKQENEKVSAETLGKLLKIVLAQVILHEMKKL